MASALEDNFLSLDQDTNYFLVEAGIELQIFYTTIRDFTSWANWNLFTISYFDYALHPTNVIYSVL